MTFPQGYKLFIRLVALTSIPLMLCIYLYFDSPKWRFLADIAVWILVLFGLVGSVYGFQSYVVQGAPTPVALVRRALARRQVADKCRPSASVMRSSVAFMLAVIAAGTFWLRVADITRATHLDASHGEVQLEKAGSYTLHFSGLAREVNVQVAIIRGESGSHLSI